MSSSYASEVNRPHTPEELRQIIETAKKERAEMHKKRKQQLQSQNSSSGKIITRTFKATHESIKEQP